MSKRKLLLIVGPTRAGKDTLAQYIVDTYNYNFVCSYTTRPMRDYETNGKEHWFVSEEEMQAILETGKAFAYVLHEDTGIEYCSTPDSLVGDKILYVIEPSGVEYIRKNLDPAEFDIKVVYCKCPVAVLRERALTTGIPRSVFNTRYYSELKTMLEFEKAGNYDLLVDCSISIERTLEQFDKWFRKTP